MKTLIINTLFIISLTSTAMAQYQVMTEDQAEYAKYLTYCNEIISDTTKQDGKVRLEKQKDGSYMDMNGNSTPIDTIWTIPYPSYDQKNVMLEPNETYIYRKVILRVKRRSNSPTDFYKYWIPLQKRH